MNATTLARQVKTIFSLPEIVLQVNHILRQPEPDLAELEERIINDPGLTASILKVVNSAYYSLPNKIDTLSRAIAIIGFRELSAIVIGTSVTRQFNGIAPEWVDMNVFWFHSITRGILAKNLATHSKCNNSERFFIAGLLSGIGKLIFFTQYPNQSAEIIRMGQQGDAALAEAERKLFGFDYAELSAELLKEWKLPIEIWEIVAYLFKPLDSPIQKTDACILHVASSIANNIQPCANYDFDTHPLDALFNPGVLEHLQLTPNAIQSISLDALLQSMEVVSIIHPETMIIF